MEENQEAKQPKSEDTPAQTEQSENIQTENKETISLGGNITLNGFQNVERSKMIVLKKMIGNYVKQIQEKKTDYEKIAITLEGENKVKVELTAGTPTTAEVTQNNIFAAIDATLKKILEQL